MSKQRRIHYPNGFYQVKLSANVQQSLFVIQQDVDYFYHLLHQGTQRYHYRCHAFCLLPDAIHLLIQISEQPLSKLMHNLSFRYTRYFQQQHDYQGHVFSGRYKAVLLEPGANVLASLRYIHLQPVREKLIDNANQYEWSGQKAYMGKQHVNFLTSEQLLQQFDPDLQQARVFYQGYLLASLRKPSASAVIDVTTPVGIIGSRDFIGKVARLEAPSSTLHIDDLVTLVCQQFNLSRKMLMALGKQRHTADARGMLAMLVKQQPHINFVDLAKLMQRDASSLSSHASRMEQRCRNNKHLQQQFEQLSAKLALRAA